MTLCRFFHDFIHVGAGADNANGINFEHQTKLLQFRSFAGSFRRTALNSDLTYIFPLFNTRI